MNHLESFINANNLEPSDISVLRSNVKLFYKYYLWQKEVDSWESLRGVNYNDMIDELVEVKTDLGKIETAYPTFYDFKIVNGKVVKCDKYWNGGFLREGFSKGNITHYRRIN
jgi:hypothetical protein